jgi:integrase
MRPENGTGSIRLRPDGRYEARIYLPDGKRKSIFGKTKREVSDKLKATRRDIDAGLDVTIDTLTVAAFLDQWREDVVKRTTAAKTQHSYAGLVRLLIMPAVGHYKLKDLRQPHVDAMLRAMTDKGLSPRTVQYARAVLRAALTYAQRAGMIDRNAAQYAKPPARVNKECAYLTADQAALLLDTAREHDAQLAPLLTVALYTGLRSGELAGLRWGDIDIPARRLRVRQTVVWINGAFSFGTPKTERSKRTLSLLTPALDALQEQRDRQTFWNAQAGDRWRPFDLVFSSVLGTPIEHRNVSRRLHAVLDKAGLPRVGFHTLRHSCASLLLASGQSMRQVMEQLGHSQMSLTSDLYAHVSPAMLADNADALERAMAGF